MADISTLYAGLTLRSPLVVASSGLTNKVHKVKAHEEAGAGAVVLKSIFEEQMEQEAAYMSQDSDYPEAMDYLRHYVTSNALSTHIDLIKACRDSVSIPVIASINCYKRDTWMDYARQLVEAGASAIELNVMRIDTDVNEEAGTHESGLVRMVQEMVSSVKVPVIVKLSKFFTNFCKLSKDLYNAGAAGVVLFNRMYMPDIDINKEEIIIGNVFSSSRDLFDSLRYTALVRGTTPQLSIGISSGVRSGEDVIKSILAGADTVQLCTLLYQNGSQMITRLNEHLYHWMEEKKYESVEEFKSRLAATRVDHFNLYQRSQFMKHFSSYDETPINTATPPKDHPGLAY
ncbi:dihydroorotate dehydrogenase-like protein [Porphyromonas cangingivalis]|uniref:Dihydroorotate dehydrogenase (Fumarate) n=1 Tax=Porphyromonas cangingivalis TaxID=36874 RepID=A0A099WT91_PORCN|nr:dihydroorotate dehydrogenase-like protein [Porphyromonas cangingivalis]KGL47325.1 hypothetical protein HQ34_09650 [Porphyromonas cangingivalis]KGN81911.1 hypothetical protein HQ35_03370 [Porphyromonas cangingivalis]SJZ58059.1 dihydroorotate dehydrogenase (fumarate) [Porphyromonas cangingivalis]SPY34396.1 NAD-dependent dihydropyrimidine dehydrogenase subunit PreA [Porphyromonas cangingivalis]VEJ02004.1 NAD-dependent dihydropyrimidine dehydrogenase subunit PreA [Porphyromonas cangingivalis]